VRYPNYRDEDLEMSIQKNSPRFSHIEDANEHSNYKSIIFYVIPKPAILWIMIFTLERCCESASVHRVKFSVKMVYYHTVNQRRLPFGSNSPPKNLAVCKEDFKKSGALIKEDKI
jgi:hypothetical protein